MDSRKGPISQKLRTDWQLQGSSPAARKIGCARLASDHEADVKPATEELKASADPMPNRRRVETDVLTVSEQSKCWCTDNERSQDNSKW